MGGAGGWALLPRRQARASRRARNYRFRARPFAQLRRPPECPTQVISRCGAALQGTKAMSSCELVRRVSKPFAPLHTTNKGAKTMTIAHLSKPLRARPPITRLQFVQYLLCQPLYIMMTLMVTEALLAALTTWLMIRAGR